MNRLKELRKESKMTQKTFAKTFGVPLRTLQNWENGESQIKPDKAQQLADYFGVPVGFLLGYDEYFNSISKEYSTEILITDINDSLIFLTDSELLVIRDLIRMIANKDN